MNYLSQLQEQDTITLPEALNASQQIVQKYLPMLRKIMEIQQAMPVRDDEPTFRSAHVAKSAVPQLCEMLEKFDHAITTLETALARGNQQSLNEQETSELEQQVGEKLIKMLNAAVKHCESVYTQRSNTFSMILQDLRVLLSILHAKLNVVSAQKTSEMVNGDTVILDRPQEVPELLLESDEKLVFVRVFYRGMASLASGKGHLQWLKPLLDSVKQAEKHGMAIYEHEADVVKSLKGDAYGYVTVKIKNSQDISHERPIKVDPALGCRLLTITQVDLADMVKLTHQSVEYWIRDGVLHKVV